MKMLERARVVRSRHPVAWDTAKRALLTAGALGGLYVARRKAGQVVQRSLAATDRGRFRLLTIRRTRPFMTRDFGEARVVRAERVTKHRLGRLRQQRAQVQRRYHRLGTAMKVTGGLGVGYVGMPLARKRGERNFTRAIRQTTPRTTVMRKRSWNR